MKTFKRIKAMFLMIIMAVITIGTTTAFAAEPKNEDTVWIDGSAAGNPFVCRSNFMTAEINFTPSNGSVILAVRLIDQTTNQRINEWQNSDGHMTFKQNVTPGHT